MFERVLAQKYFIFLWQSIRTDVERHQVENRAGKKKMRLQKTK